MTSWSSVDVRCRAMSRSATTRRRRSWTAASRSNPGCVTRRSSRSAWRPAQAQTARVERNQVNGHPLVHNYGHGGSGVTVSWGCAEEALSLVQQRSPRSTHSSDGVRPLQRRSEPLRRLDQLRAREHRERQPNPIVTRPPIQAGRAEVEPGAGHERDPPLLRHRDQPRRRDPDRQGQPHETSPRPGPVRAARVGLGAALRSVCRAGRRTGGAAGPRGRRSGRRCRRSPSSSRRSG